MPRPQPATLHPACTLFLLLVLLLAPGGCTLGASSAPGAFEPPELHLPGVVHLASVTQLQRRLAQQGQGAPLWDFTAYLAAPTAAGNTGAGGSGGEERAVRVLVELGPSYQRDLYDVALEGSAADARRLATPVPCTGRLAVAESGASVACETAQGIEDNPLTSQLPGTGRLLIANTGDLRYSDPAWSPDGQELVAVILRDGGCDLGLYGVSPAHTVVQHLTLLTLRQFDVRPNPGFECVVRWPTWAADGQGLTFMASSPSSATAVYRLALAPVRAALAQTADRPVTLALGDDLLTRVGDVGYIGYPSFAWLPTAHATALFAIAAHTLSIERLDPASGYVTMVLTLPRGSMCGLAAVPTRGQLLFRYCYYAGDLYSPEQVYLFTPPSG